ncbi:hypothetical protein MSG_04227 [Mycobacterium shigaense]|uniref:Uncharacterized protein n=2 Tax=Mycobacterium shigaense TaxID=722731 RepID=A0A1Z4EN20_9MYCO|nr:hypothetical protein [Mycobacterium shigaense]MEA1120577.1 hypothetical protein [Mycobacterium shigaense]PRI14201.1 hypothetical protein B2J96_15890 [Mycobacterium shigaense]BAX94348.1 hypothetical protein MSG_04227 [Mycobacterium shigaense]
MSAGAKTVLAAGAASLLAGAGLMTGTSPAHADPVWHQVVYVVSAKVPTYVDIFYQDQDPTLFSDYSHNPYSFSPQVHADITPDKPWVQPVNLLNPDQWAMVTATTGRAPETPGGIQCNLSVDGKVVVSKLGPKGALCSLRTW